ncbi:short chain dehydrogenase [Derxia lacustris]|uniref:short chain dehydrogenase n=1 Tax=Derxia lacustris TaxID=764842 RepID=UPI000A170670|nr:short chain dehydrogenase [Derxia lacustris]
MKIVIVGATGTLGQAIVAQLGARHEIVAVGRTSGARHADITDAASIAAALGAIGRFDAIVAAAGDPHFGPLAETTPAQFAVGLHGKLLGQINVALAALPLLNDGGSITLTSGCLSDWPVRGGANASVANSGIDAFARAAAVDVPRGIRINAVSPTVLTESLPKYGAFLPGFEDAPAEKVARAYRRSIEGAETGQVFRVWG